MVNSFNFGVVIYNNKKEEIYRLISSIYESCRVAKVEFNITLLMNSDTEIPCCNDVEFDFDVIPYTNNMGFGAGHNSIVSSLKKSKRWYVGLNPDGFMLPSSMAHACAWLNDNKNIYEFRQTPQEHPKLFIPKSGDTAWCSGAAFIMDINKYIELGGFDENMFMYCEDVDLSWKVLNSGGRCICMGNALFFHDVVDRKYSDDVLYYMHNSQAVLAHKWGDHAFQLTAKRKSQKISRGRKVGIKDYHPEPLYAEGSTPYFCDFGNLGHFSDVRWGKN